MAGPNLIVLTAALLLPGPPDGVSAADEAALREAAMRSVIALYDGLEEQYDDPVGRRYCLAFDVSATAEGRAVGRDFLRRFEDHPHVHPKAWCQRQRGRLLSVGPVEWLGPGEARIWSFSWVRSRPGGRACLHRATRVEGAWRVGERCEEGSVYN